MGTSSMTSESSHGYPMSASAEASSPTITTTNAMIAGIRVSSPVEKTTTLDGLAEESGDESRKVKQPLSFYLAFSCLLVMVFLCAMDSTIMAVSIPVSLSPP